MVADSILLGVVNGWQSLFVCEKMNVTQKSKVS